jgi:hypothetical protein
VAAGFAQLLRDLLSLDPADRLLARWRPLDHLIALQLLWEHSPKLRPFSRGLDDQVDAWMEAALEQVPLLYREWIASGEGTSRTGELLGSLGTLPRRGEHSRDKWAHKTAYLAVFHAIILHQRGQGTLLMDLARRWRIADSIEGEERWRDDLLWLLTGIASLLDVRCFYFHLREACAADRERIRRVKRLLGRMRAQAFDLQAHLNYCSPLGPLLRSLRRTQLTGSSASVGVQSIRRLEETGIRSIAELAHVEVDDLVRLGIRRDLAKQLRTYVRRRLQ